MCPSESFDSKLNSVACSTDAVDQVSTRVVRYLEDHPDASDGRLGIRDFWLGGFPLPQDSEALDKALDALVDASVLMRVQLPGGETIYRLRKTT